MAEGVCGGAVSQLIRQPEQEPQHRVASTPADPGKEEEGDLEPEDEDHQDLDGPMVPDVPWPSSSSHCSCPHGAAG